VTITCDHIVPLARGGKNNLENLVAACDSCNCNKATLLIEEWRPELAAKLQWYLDNLAADDSRPSS
jgi:5-methylcytosine-specific restriction endonuclease McrA